tara:strand:+ start:2113 stop:2550 length:438 start_codon:yes stop_codon:yes gene_type:complete
MAVSYTNNWKNILDKLKNILRTEFKGAMDIYVGHSSKVSGSQFIRLDPEGSELLEYMANSETREFTINMNYYFLDKNINQSSLEHVLAQTSRIEALIHDNVNVTLADSTNLLNCRIENTELNALEEENEYVVQLVFKAQHQGNFS